MIVVDSSAVIAIFRQEDDAARYARCIAADDDPIISAANIVETSIVLRGLKKIAPDRAERWLDEFIETAGIRIGNAGAGGYSPLSPSPVRKGDRPCRGVELRRLFFLRTGEGNECPTAL